MVRVADGQADAARAPVYADYSARLWERVEIICNHVILLNGIIREKMAFGKEQLSKFVGRGPRRFFIGRSYHGVH